MTDTLDFSRKWNDAPVWPERDPEPEVSNRDPRPVDAPAIPKSVSDLAALAKAAGWEIRIGYSRALLRGTANSTYRMVETYGVWFGTDHVSGWRASAMYQRFADAGEIRHFNGKTIEPDASTRKGKPGTWTWKAVTIFSGFKRHEVNVTDLKEFVTVRGSVLPTWFDTIRERKSDQKEKQREAVRNRPKHKEGAN